jgi:hypothetical protein
LAGQPGKGKLGVDPKILLKKEPLRGKFLGVDPSLRGTGLRFLNAMGNYKLLHSETLKLGNKVSSIACLGKIHELGGSFDFLVATTPPFL